MTDVIDDDRDRPTVRDSQRAKALWEPTWTLDTEAIPLGATIDDGCIVFLGQDLDGDWVPLTHIPAPAMRFATKLLAGARDG